MVKTKRGLPPMTYLPDRELYKKRGSYKGQKYNFTSKDPEEIMAKIKAFEAWVDGGKIDNNITVWEYIQRWHPLRIAGLKPMTVQASYDIPINKYIVPKIGNLKMTDVKPLHIDAIFSDISDKSTSLTHKVDVVLKQIFASAVDNDIITKNPCITSNGSKRKIGGVKQQKKKPLTREQQETLVKAVEGTRAELFVLLCLYAGLRREEALGLLWPDVHLDVDSPHIDVRHTITFDTKGKPIHSAELKTSAAYRTIPIPEQLTNALCRWKGKNASFFVIPSAQSGQEMSLSAFNRMWGLVVGHSYKTNVKGNEDNIKREVPGLVDFYVTPHLLRHTYITELCSSGMDIKKIQYLAGHTSAKMTLDVYAEVVDNRPDELGPAISKHFSGTLAGTLE